MSPFVTVDTIHRSQVSWWWTDARLHDNDYWLKVNDAVDQAVKKAESDHEVIQDTRYCCQWEGLQFLGGDLAAVTSAAADVAKVLARFKGVRPLV